MKTTKKTTLIRLIVVFLLALSATAYALADRYLIEHVEIANASAVSGTTQATMPVASAQENGNVLAAPSSIRPTPTLEEAAVSESVISDDWNYQSETVSISIEKVTTGSEKNTLTYFLADVVLSDATQLSSAFAKNSFGRNIIAYTSEIAEENQAVFAVNGDYYGFRTDGIVIRNGKIYRDIPTRTGLAFYQDGTMKIYDETQTSAQALLDEGVWNTLSFGPALVEDGMVVADLSKDRIDTNLGNHSIQGNNPRTGVGMISDNHFVFVVVDGRSTGYSRGASLAEFAQIFEDLGCTEAYNIDGGGSSTMYFMGRVVNNPLGRNKERGTSDILFIGS